MTSQADLEAFRSHGLWSETNAALTEVAALHPRTDEDRHTVARVKAVIAYVEAFARVSTYLLPSDRVTTADSLAQQASSIRGQLSGWDQAAAMLPPTVAAIDTSCDEITRILSSSHWPALQRERWTTATAQSADAYRTAMDGAISAAQGDLQVLGTEVSTFRAEISNLSTVAKEREAEAETALATMSTAISEQEVNAAKQLDADLAKIRKAFEDQRLTLDEEAQRFLVGLEVAYVRGSDLVKKVADQSVGGEYLAFAGREHRAYRLWIFAGVASVVATFLFLGVVFVGPLIGDWIRPTEGVDNVLLKLGISVSIAGFSVYAFREAGKRLRQSVAAHYRALDVIALPPFSQDLTEAQQQNLRYLMGERLFGSRIGEDEPARRKGTENTLTLAVDLSGLKNGAEAAKAIKETLS